MKATHFFLLCVLGAALLSTVLCIYGNGPDNCCFKLYEKRVKKTVIGSYSFTDHRCPKPAIILVTKKNFRRICVDPTRPWVKTVIQHVDKNNFK